MSTLGALSFGMHVDRLGSHVVPLFADRDSHFPDDGCGHVLDQDGNVLIWDRLVSRLSRVALPAAAAGGGEQDKGRCCA